VTVGFVEDSASNASQTNQDEVFVDSLGGCTMNGEANGNAKQRAALWIGVVFLLGASLGGVLGYHFGRA